MTIGDLIVRVGANIDGFKTAMGDVSSSLAATASKMSSVGMSMTAAVTLPIVGVGIAAIKTAGELEQNAIAFETLMGSAAAAQKHLQDLRDFAAKTPFQFTELTIASKRMQALGFDAKDVLPTLRNVGDAAAALGMGAEGMQRIITALGQMKAKGMVQAEEMRQLAEAGIPAWQILAKTLNTDVAGAMKAVENRTVEAATAIPAILAGMNEKFGGLMAKQAKTLLGQWSDLKDKITFTLTDIGTALMPIAKTMMESVLKPAFSGLKELAEGFAALPKPVQTAALGLVGFAAVVGPSMFVVGKLITVIQDFHKIVTVSMIPSIISLGNVVAGLGSTSLSLLITRFAGVGAGYAAMLATGVLRLSGWVALAAAVWELVQAYRGLEEAKAGLAAAEKLQQDSLLKLEISLKRQGADISDLQRQYAQGQITWTQYMQKLRDVSIELGKNAAAHKDNAHAAQAAMTTSEAFGVKLQALQADVVKARAALDLATSKYKDHQVTADAVAKAYDGWQSATSALKSAQDSLLPVVTNVHKATREFVDIAGREFPDAQKAAANAAQALNVKLEKQSLEIYNAQKFLDYAIERWNKYHDNAEQVTKALDDLQSAQAKVNKEIDNLPDPDKAFAKWRKALAAVGKDGIYDALIPALKEAPPLVRTLNYDLLELGLKARDAAGEVTTKLLRAFDDLATKQKPTLEEAHLAWAAVSSDVNRLARYDLPAALKVYVEYEALLKRIGASEGEILAVRGAQLQTQIRLAEQSGKMATGDIIALQNVRIHQQGLYDQTHLLGDLYVDVTDDIMKGFQSAGKSVSDAIWNTKDLEKEIHGVGSAMEVAGKKIVKSILDDVVNTAFKALKTAILESTGLMGALTKSLGSILGSGASAAASVGSTIVDETGAAVNIGSTAASAGSPASGAAGAAASSITGIVGAVGSVVSAISGVISNFQMSGMNKSLDVIVNHTLRTANDLANLRADEWDREGHLMLKLDDMWNEIRNVVTAVSRMGMPEFATAAPGVVNINVYGASDTDEVVNRVAQHLKRNGVYV